MKSLRAVLIFVLATVFLFSLSHIGLQLYQQRISAESNREATVLAKAELPSETADTEAAEATEPSSPNTISGEIVLRDLLINDPMAESLLQIRLEALVEVNPEVIGWITIPGTIISYPVVQGNDNQHYLDYTWDQAASYQGSIFMECRSNADLSDFNTIIYGHNLLDGTMFSQLHLYKNAEFLKEHPYIYIVNHSGAFRYRIFAVFEAPTNASAYRLRFSADQMQTFLADSQSRSLHDTGILPSTEDHILTLSTCTGAIPTNRWIVQACLEGEITGERALSTSAEATGSESSAP